MAEAKTVSQGDYIDYTPATAVAAGTVVVQGDLVGIATRAIEANQLGALAVDGVFDIAKAGATTFAAGAKVYWDDTNNVAVTTDGGGTNKFVGKAIKAASSGETTVRVLLSQ
jgi:predicted RecA/RadA family phage recombinase